MEYIYLVLLIVSLGMLFWLKIFDVRNSTTQFVCILVLVASNMGFYLTSISSTVEEALVAQKIAYVGGVFLPAFYFLLILEICHIKVHRAVGIIVLFVQCIIYGLALSIGKSDLFYKSASLVIKNGNVILVKEYGPLHVIFSASIFIYLVAAIGVTLYALVKKTSINRKGVLVMALFAVLAVSAYVWEKVAHFEYEIVPLVYVIIEIGELIPMYKTNLYTVYEQKEIIERQLSEVGFLTFDAKKIYQNSNHYIENIFPELIKCHVGQKIVDCSSELQQIIDQIDISAREDPIQLVPFWLDGKYYVGTIYAVKNAFGYLKGYTIELRDDTADRMVIDLKESYNEELSRDVYEKTRRIRFIQQKTIMGMAQMVESRDLSTGGHIKRTSDVVRIFSKKLMSSNLGFERHFLHHVIRSAPMHDIGKIGVDDAILRKQGKFTDEEYSQMKKHSEIGFHMVSEILSDVEEADFVSVAKNVAHYHHEKVDGTGYPHGLKGDEIPVEARIMALADVFDALVSKRCYKDAFSYDKAFEIIEHDSGTHFDPQLARVFIECRPQLEEYYNKSEE